MPRVHSTSDRLLAEVERAREELVDLAAELVRVPTVNPPGEYYRECAELLGERLAACGFAVEYHVADGRPEHTPRYPRVNVVGRRRGAGRRPCIHLNGHLDVVPAGDGWSVDPFGGVVRDGRLFGRGSADMKGGLAAALIAVEALRRSGMPLRGTIEISGTVDEESGGDAGVRHLAELGLIGRDRTDHVIIPEPLDPDRICVGHRGVYWFRVVAHGRIAHGSMPFLGESAIDAMGWLLERVRRELGPALGARLTAMPVAPPEARHATINVNSVRGGQAGLEPQTPCVADRCEAVFDRRFLPEEEIEAVRADIRELVRAADGDDRWRFEVEDLMLVRPTRTPADDLLVTTLEAAVKAVLGRPAALVASPGTYDHKHVTGVGGVVSCVAYGPGRLEQAHRVDEWCAVEDLVAAAQVLALTLAELA
jgi:succinyl-diaminopimelate desuccinylase